MTSIQILGMGCQRCRKIERNAQKALRTLRISATLERIEDIDTILQYNILATPALLINGEIVASDRVVSYDEIVQLLSIPEEITS